MLVPSLTAEACSRAAGRGAMAVHVLAVGSYLYELGTSKPPLTPEKEYTNPPTEAAALSSIVMGYVAPVDHVPSTTHGVPPGVAVRVRVGPPGVMVRVGVLEGPGVLVGPQPAKVKLICMPAERPPVLHSNCVKRAAVASCTPTVAEVPVWATSPYTTSKLGEPSCKRTSKSTLPVPLKYPALHSMWNTRLGALPVVEVKIPQPPVHVVTS